MNETQVDHSRCASPSCQMVATHNRSTSGGGRWLCFVHFGTDEADHLHVTAELTRLKWLADVVRSLRAGGSISAEQQQNFVLAQRADLKQKASERAVDWMIRLEGVLQKSCKDSLVQA